jgi:hypothetical protein
MTRVPGTGNLAFMCRRPKAAVEPRQHSCFCSCHRVQGYDVSSASMTIRAAGLPRSVVPRPA